MSAAITPRNIVIAVLLLGLALLPFYVAITGNLFLLTLFTRILIVAMAAVSLNIILASIDHFPGAWRYITRKKLTATKPYVLHRPHHVTLESDESQDEPLRIASVLRAFGYRATVTREAKRTTVFGERGAWNRLGAYFVHVGLLTIFLGGFFTWRHSHNGMLTLVPGMEAQIALDGQNYPGIVTAISPEVRSGQVTGRVKFAGDQPPGLRQSQRGSVRIVIEQRAKAVKFERSADIVSGTKAVYVVHDDTAVLTPVQLGAAAVGEIEVLDGLKPGDQVVISGTGELKEVPEFHIGG